MRILVAIPHYYKPGASRSLHASGRAQARDTRRMALARSILQLKGLFSAGSAVGANYADECLEPVPLTAGQTDNLHIAVLTDGAHHLLDDLGIPASWYTHQKCEGDPRHLGFACHRLLAENAGRFDFLCYIEDDIVVHDPDFFAKVALFNQAARNPKALLVPHRYEVPIDLPQATGTGVARVYPDLSGVSQAIPYEGQRVGIDWIGRKVTIEVARNVHSGCWALTQEQMVLFSASPTFLQTEPVWVTPLDMAATFTIRNTFRVFKPAPDSVTYLEVEHASPLVARQITGDAHPNWRPQVIPKQG